MRKLLPLLLSASLLLPCSVMALDTGKMSVNSADTLWRIANNVKPTPRVTANQTMLAIIDKNPRAFILRNVNGLKAGYTLKLPTVVEIKENSAMNAEQKVIQQHQAWQGKNPVQRLRMARQMKLVAVQQQVSRTEPEDSDAVMKNIMQAQIEKIQNKVEKPEVAPSSAPAKSSLSQALPPPTTRIEQDTRLLSVFDSLSKYRPPVEDTTQRLPPKQLIQANDTKAINNETTPTKQAQSPQNEEDIASSNQDKQIDTQSSPLLASASRQLSELEEAIRTELAISVETANKAAQSNKRLTAQIADLQQENQNLKQQLLMRSKELLALKTKAGSFSSLAPESSLSTVAKPVIDVEKESITSKIKRLIFIKYNTAWTKPLLLILALLLISSISVFGLMQWRKKRYASEELSFDEAEEFEDFDDEVDDCCQDETRCSNADVNFDELAAGDDVIATKLDLATAYVNMGDPDNAKKLLVEVMTKGSEEQQLEAESLVMQIRQLS